LPTLADGVFAIVITLLVLDLYVPRGPEPDQYRQALRQVLPDLRAWECSELRSRDRSHSRSRRVPAAVDRSRDSW
jgi:hypothetical protein